MISLSYRKWINFANGNLFDNLIISAIMESVLLEYMINNWPTIAIVIIVAVSSGILVRKFTRWEDRHNQRHDDLDKELSEISGKIGRAAERIERMDKDMLLFKSVMSMKDAELRDAFSLKFSPRRLNENGLKVFDDIDGKAFLSANKDFLFSKIDERNPKAALDVEEAAYYVLVVNTENEIFKPLKDFVYKSPTYTLKGQSGEDKTYDLSLNDVCFILSLPLRDMYLKEHPELSVE